MTCEIFERRESAVMPGGAQHDAFAFMEMRSCGRSKSPLDGYPQGLQP
jgi:hypothetical protein